MKVTQPSRQVGGTVCSASTAPVVRTAAHPLLGCFFPPQGSLPFTPHAAEETEAATGTNTTQTEVPDSRNKPMPKDLIRICLAAHTENFLTGRGCVSVAMFCYKFAMECRLAICLHNFSSCFAPQLALTQFPDNFPK